MRRMNDLYFDEQSLSALGVTVSQRNRYDAPERDIKEVEVPGRNGTYVIDNGRFKNIMIHYHVNIEENFEAKAPLIRDFLLGKNGCNTYEYKDLRDTYDWGEIREAVYAGDISFDVGELQKYGECDLAFNCKPQRYSYEDFRHPIEIPGTGEVVMELLTKDEASRRWDANVPSSYARNRFTDDDSAYYWVEVIYQANKLVELCINTDTIRKDVSAKYAVTSKLPSEGGFFGSAGFKKHGECVIHIPNKQYLVMYIPVVSGIKAFVADYNLFPGTSSKKEYIEIPEEQKYYIYDYSANNYVVNVPSNYSCFPLIHFDIEEPTDGLLCSIGGKGFYVTGITQEVVDSMNGFPLILDTESMEVTCNGVNFNKYAFFDGDIKLEPGDNIVYIGACTSAQITRRWYTI